MPNALAHTNERWEGGGAWWLEAAADGAEAVTGFACAEAVVHRSVWWLSAQSLGALSEFLCHSWHS